MWRRRSWRPIRAHPPPLRRRHHEAGGVDRRWFRHGGAQLRRRRSHRRARAGAHVPGFITSNLVGVDEDGTLIKEFEASHGTVTDMDEARLRGEETSLNPLGMVEGLIGAMNHAADVHGGADRVHPFTGNVRSAIHKLFRGRAPATCAGRADSPPSSSSTPSRRRSPSERARGAHDRDREGPERRLRTAES